MVFEQSTIYKEFYLFLLFTGVRSNNEAGALTWDRINWRSNTFLLTDTRNKENADLPFPSCMVPLLEQRKKAVG